ncbi:MAG: hypothetical protein Q9181_003569 [Wetmoreana brouardii]
MTFKVLDVEKAPATQGFKPHSYDFVIASNVLHATASLKRTLENTRQLLKLGGYLLLLELTNNRPIRCSSIMAGLPGTWHTALRKAEFSGIDAIIPKIDVLPWPFSIIAAQAVDDRVQFLRQPLGYSSNSIFLENIVILGTGSLRSACIAEEVKEHLRCFCGRTTILDGLPTEAQALALNPMSTFINLVDIDSPIFKGVTAEKMDGLKRVFELARHILWITVGALADVPYYQASIAFSRAMGHEAGHVSLNHLNISDLERSVSQIVPEHLLRQYALAEWAATRDRQKHQGSLWLKEPEMFLDRGNLIVARVIDNVGQNARLNSLRRIITRTVPMSSSNISIILSTKPPPSLVERSSSLTGKDDRDVVRVETSSLMALHVAASTFLFLGIGKNNVTKETVVTLSATNSCGVNPIAYVAAGVDDVAQPTDRQLIAIASEFLAASLLETILSCSRIIVHCSSRDPFFTAALSRLAAVNAIRVIFTYDAQYTDDAQNPTWIKFSARTPKHVLRRLLLPAKPIYFLDVTANSRINPNRLKDAMADAKKLVTDTASEEVKSLIIELDQIHDPNVPNYTTSVFYWPLHGDIVVEVRPLDVSRLFSQNKTYLLVGITGAIGRSACE